MDPRLKAKVEQIKSQIRSLFGDTSVPKDQTREALEDIQEEVESYIEGLL